VIRPWYGFFMALVTALMWGVLPVVFTLLRGGPDPLAVTWIRFLFSALVVLAVLWRSKRLPALRAWRPREWTWLLLAIAFLAGNFVLYLLGLGQITPEATAVLIQLAPFILMFGSVFVFGERFGRVEWCGTLLLFGGLLLFFNDRLGLLTSAVSGETLGIVYILLAAVSWGFYGLLQKALLRTMGSVQLTLMMYGGGAILLAPLSDVTSLWHMTAVQDWAVLFGCLNMVIGYGAFTEALGAWQGAKVSAVIALAPVLTMIFTPMAAWLWPQLFSPSALNGSRFDASRARQGQEQGSGSKFVRRVIDAVEDAHGAEFEGIDAIEARHVKAELVGIGAPLVMRVYPANRAKVVFGHARVELVQPQQFMSLDDAQAVERH
jgi:drug/metabolite transporter (DMT)-like permease